MRAPSRPARLGVRLLRFAGVLAALTALVAIIAILRGDPLGRGETLIGASIMLGAIALAGLTLLPLAHHWKGKP